MRNTKNQVVGCQKAMDAIAKLEGCTMTREILEVGRELLTFVHTVLAFFQNIFYIFEYFIRRPELGNM